jgi:hypothetical protein
MYHSRNGINTNAKVRARIATSHFLAILGLGAVEEGFAAWGMLVIVFSI